MLALADSRSKPLARLCRAALVVAAAIACHSGAAATEQPPDPRLAAALASLQPQRPGVVDAYVIVVALDDEPVFGREAREAGRVLEQRFDAVGRTLVLAGDEGNDRADAAGSTGHLAVTLEHAAQLMDENEDVLVLYSTSHGLPDKGLVYRVAGKEVETIGPERLASLLEPHGFRNRLLMIQACYSGQFVPLLASPGTVLLTAASAERPSFGCHPGNDWTLFGDALVNHAFRAPGPLVVQFSRAVGLITLTEMHLGMPASNPQLSIGDETDWIGELDRRAPTRSGKPVGRPTLDAAI
jgi:hypothetical protein